MSEWHKPVRARGTLMALLAAAAAALLVAQPLGATPPQDASGTSARLTSTVVDTRQADGNTFLTLFNTGVMTGTIAGSFTAEVRLVLHPSGRITGHVTRRCACTVDGRSGVVVFRAEVTGEAGAPPVFDNRLTSIDATGGLEGLHAVLREHQVGVAGPYSGTYHFDP